MLTTMQRIDRKRVREARAEAKKKAEADSLLKSGIPLPTFIPVAWYLRADAFVKKAARLFVPSSYECTRRSDGVKYQRPCFRAVADGATRPVRRKGDTWRTA